MEKSKTPIWKRSMLQHLNYWDIKEILNEISCNGDSYGYDYGSTDSYYDEYKPFFDELADGAETMLSDMSDLEYDFEHTNGEWQKRTVWDDFTVALLGQVDDVLGYDVVQQDYRRLIDQSDWAIEEAEKRLMRFTKAELISYFRKILVTLVMTLDMKSAHDCLVSIVEELDERAAIMKNENNRIPQRMWVE